MKGMVKETKRERERDELWGESINWRVIGFGARHPAEVAAINSDYLEKMLEFCVGRMSGGADFQADIWDAAKDRRHSNQRGTGWRGIVRSQLFRHCSLGKWAHEIGYLSSLGSVW